MSDSDTASGTVPAQPDTSHASVRRFRTNEELEDYVLRRIAESKGADALSARFSTGVIFALIAAVLSFVLVALGIGGLGDSVSTYLKAAGVGFVVGMILGASVARFFVGFVVGVIVAVVTMVVAGELGVGN